MSDLRIKSVFGVTKLIVVNPDDILTRVKSDITKKKTQKILAILDDYS